MKNILCRYAAIVVPLMILSTNAFSLTKPAATDLQKGYNKNKKTCQSQAVNYWVEAGAFRDDDKDGISIVNIPAEIQPNPVAYVEMPEGSNITWAILNVNVQNAIICVKASKIDNTIKVDADQWTSVSIKYATETNNPPLIRFESQDNSLSQDSVMFLGKMSGTTHVITGGGNDDITGPVEASFSGDHLFLVSAGDGDDYIKGSFDYDELDGNGGNDTIEALGGEDIVFGSSGNDTIHLNKGKELDPFDGFMWALEDRSEIEIAYMSTIPDNEAGVVDGGAGNDTIWGSNGADILHGGSGNDYIYGMDGDDDIFGENGNDYLFGMEGSDSVSGGNGVDRRLPSFFNGKKD